MTFLRFVFISLALTVSVGAARAEDCALKQVASLAMSGAYPGRVVVDVSIAGKPRHFLVDTGGVFTSIYQDVADGMGLSTHAIDQSVEIYDVEGARSKRYTKVPDLTIGTMSSDDIPVLVEPRPPGSNRQIDGVLALDILSKFDLDFDFANHKLNLISQDHCAGKTVYWSGDYTDADFELQRGHIVLPMMLDGKTVSATLDTGAVNTHIYEPTARRLFDLDSHAPGMEPIPGAPPDAVDQFRYRFKSLSIGGLAINNPTIYILQDLALQSFAMNHVDKEDFDPIHATHLDQTDMLLGMNVLSKLHLYVAYREHKIYLTTADAH